MGQFYRFSWDSQLFVDLIVGQNYRFNMGHFIDLVWDTRYICLQILKYCSPSKAKAFYLSIFINLYRFFLDFYRFLAILSILSDI